MRALLLALLAAAALWAAGCPSPPEPSPDAAWMCLLGPNKAIPSGALVYGGARAPTSVPLREAQVDAVVGISTQPVDSFCTGTLISDDVVLTAKHCTLGVPGSSLTVLFGQDDFDPILVADVEEKREHEDLDLALLRLVEAPAESIDVEPIPIAARDLEPGDVGITLEQAGYGRTEDGSEEGRFFVAERLWGFEGTGAHLVVDGQGERGVCAGDSGGPSLRTNAFGEARVVGALAWGDYSCVDRDRYARVGPARAFIEDWAGPTPPPGPVACQDAPVVDHCLPGGSVGFFCEDGELVVDECSAEEVCVSGRCQARSEAPCGGETAFGRCEGSTLRWCQAGEPRSRDCARCGEVCTVVDQAVGMACVPSGCGDLDERGRCEGQTAEWCAKGRVVTRDCESEGMDCVETEYGVTCLQDLACGDLDYRGECQGDVARWCDDGVRMVRDCAEDGGSCGFVSEEVGYYCRSD